MRKLTKKRIKKNKRKTRKSIKRTKRNRKGGENDKVNCCMCGTEVSINYTLIPRECLNKYGRNAHRICSECWWNSVSGFAREDAPHGCPGCIKKLPLTKVQIKEPEVVDLTLDDD